jgi:flagellar biosynthetic protein FliQ
LFVDDVYLELARQAIIITLKVGLPVLLGGIVIGLAISILQSVTQIQEQTLTLVPKIVVMGGVSVALMPWIAQRVADFAIVMFTFN